MKKHLIFAAPNIHTGGGAALLEALFANWPGDLQVVAFFLDARLRGRIAVPSSEDVIWVHPSIGGRVLAELRLRTAGPKNCTVFCFNGQAPLLRPNSRLILFVQNRLHFDDAIEVGRFSFRTRLRLIFERVVNRVARYRVAEYIVQTPSMKRALLRKLGGTAPNVRVIPFIDTVPIAPVAVTLQSKNWDFVYVADGEAHKNHRNLVEAWRLLRKEGLRVSLVLTLGARDTLLWEWIEEIRNAEDLRIENVGNISRQELFKLYGQAAALIFPSVAESFGMPLIEAAQLGLPIVASELDFVRDVADPIQTFDPESSISIARAVKRFIGEPGPFPRIRTPAEFLSELSELL